jgi:hypothetical protein
VAYEHHVIVRVATQKCLGSIMIVAVQTGLIRFPTPRAETLLRAIASTGLPAIRPSELLISP